MTKTYKTKREYALDFIDKVIPGDWLNIHRSGKKFMEGWFMNVDFGRMVMWVHDPKLNLEICIDLEEEELGIYVVSRV